MNVLRDARTVRHFVICNCLSLSLSLCLCLPLASLRAQPQSSLLGLPRPQPQSQQLQPSLLGQSLPQPLSSSQPLQPSLLGQSLPQPQQPSLSERLRSQPQPPDSLLPDSISHSILREPPFAEEWWEDCLLDYLENASDEEAGRVELDDEQTEIYQLSQASVFLSFSRESRNINTLDEDYLKQVLRLSDYQYYQLCRYVTLFGEIMSYAELAAVDGFSMDWVSRNASLFNVGKTTAHTKERFSWKKLSQGKFLVLARVEQTLEQQAAYKGVPAEYEGNPMHLLWKINYQCKDFLKIGWTAEKDPGEAFFSQSNPQGFDYNAFYLSWKGTGVIRQCLLGDYRLQYGQGLAMGVGFQMQTSAPSAVEKSFVLKPHTSANETQFLRGAALRLAPLPKCDLSLFVASQRIDASVNESDTGFWAENLQMTGYHRNQREIARENRLNQRLFGAYCSFAGNKFRLGGGWAYLTFDAPLQQSLKPYNQFKFNGQSLWNGSVDYHWNLHRTVLFGEFAASGNGTWACCNGLVCDADDRISLSLLYQYKNMDYQGIPDVLQATMKLMNEHSLQWSAQCLVGLHGCLNLSWKEMRYPWLKYGVDAPSGASRFRLRYEGRLAGGAQYIVGYAWKKGVENGTDGPVRRLFYVQKHGFTLRWHGCMAEGWSWKSRMDFQCTGFSSGSPYAVAFTQTGGYRNHRWQITAGFSLFEVTSYKVALYVSEPDLLYSLSSAYLSGKGIRLLALCSFKPIPSVTLHAKYAVFRYADRQCVGSGADLIEGNHKSALKLQMVWKF